MVKRGKYHFSCYTSHTKQLQFYQPWSVTRNVQLEPENRWRQTGFLHKTFTRVPLYKHDCSGRERQTRHFFLPLNEKSRVKCHGQLKGADDSWSVETLRGEKRLRTFHRRNWWQYQNKESQWNDQGIKTVWRRYAFKIELTQSKLYPVRSLFVYLQHVSRLISWQLKPPLPP